MSNINLSVGGRPIENYKLQDLKQGITLEEAKQTLSAENDGLDTLGIKVDDINGVDYLISGQGLDAKAGEIITLEGEAIGVVAFVEQEDNTFAEGFKSGMNTKMGGLEKSVAGAPFSLVAGLGKGAAAAAKQSTDAVINKLTATPPLTQELLDEAVQSWGQ